MAPREAPEGALLAPQLSCWVSVPGALWRSSNDEQCPCPAPSLGPSCHLPGDSRECGWCSACSFCRLAQNTLKVGLIMLFKNHFSRKQMCFL